MGLNYTDPLILVFSSIVNTTVPQDPQLVESMDMEPWIWRTVNRTSGYTPNYTLFKGQLSVISFFFINLFFFFLFIFVCVGSSLLHAGFF